MKFYSTRKNSPIVSFREALFRGQAPDGGLYMPEAFPTIEVQGLPFGEGDYKELAGHMLEALVGDEFAGAGLAEVLDKAYPFAPALTRIDDKTYVLELFHGPTLSFKDFGAQFMAKAMGYYLRNEDRDITILVATSGDTGSAVAHAYHKVEGIRIVLLYPSGKVSRTQEKQLTTLGDNISSLEVAGAFDDCQALVKRAFADGQLREKMTLSSANSINIGRLLPQSVYYFWSVLQVMARRNENAIICVPSGNFGNLCAGLFAGRMSLPMAQFIAAVNANSVVADYLATGRYQPRPSVRTLSNAMDVGHPSNWERIQELFKNDHKSIAERMWSTSVDDRATIKSMQRVYGECDYIADPHTAVGLEALEQYRCKFAARRHDPAIVLSTAHPAKFQDIVNEALGIEIELPAALQHSLGQEKRALAMPNSYDAFKEFLWEH